MSLAAKRKVLERIESALDDLRGWLDPEEPQIDEFPQDWVGSVGTWLATWNANKAEEFYRLARIYDGDAGVGDVFDYLHRQFGILSAEIEIDREPRATDQRTTNVGTGGKIFIGHGHSPIWKDLRHFLRERLHVTCDDFEAVPTAGVAHVERLREMLADAAFAFLVLTAEDETGDGRRTARANVIHEAGLFQGRLGFNRAIVLLEEGCEEFSNIAGLGQIRFPMGNIMAQSEEIRRVLEREGLVQTTGDRDAPDARRATTAAGESNETAILHKLNIEIATLERIVGPVFIFIKTLRDAFHKDHGHTDERGILVTSTELHWTPEQKSQPISISAEWEAFVSGSASPTKYVSHHTVEVGRTDDLHVSLSIWDNARKAKT